VLAVSVTDALRETEDAEVSAEPLLTALEHIEKRGSLLSLMDDRRQRLALMTALTPQKLVCWNAPAAKYELTDLGRQCLAENAKGV
jgi:hypothetical protein